MDKLLPCPFCGGEACCSHGWEYTCDHDHSETGEEASQDCVDAMTPICAFYCRTPKCPPTSTLPMASDMENIQHGTWEKAFKDAAAIWNRRAPSAGASGEK